MNSRLRRAIHKKNMLYNAYKKGKVKWDTYRKHEKFDDCNWEAVEISIFSGKMWRWSQKAIFLENNQTLCLR